MKKIVFALLAFGLLQPLAAQEVKFGKGNLAELQEEMYPADSSAAAAYLFKYRNTYFQYFSGTGFQLTTEIHERVKIYKQSGLDYATKTVYLSKNGSDNERVAELKGYTYNLEGGKVVREKLKKESIFKEEASKNSNLVKFTLPNTREGSVIEYKYKIISPFFFSIDEYVFQEDIPVKKVEAVLNILDWFKYNQMQRGSRFIRPTIVPENNVSLGEKTNRITYKIDDIPALKKENFVANMDNYRLGMKFEIVSVEIPGRMYEVYAKSWDDVVRTIYKADAFGGELKRSKYYMEDLQNALNGVNDPYAKLATVYNLVKSKVKWNEGYGKYCDKGVRNAYKEGTGNSGDINLMLVSMLRSAGINAQPVLISTRSNGIPLFPTLDGFNYVIASAEIGGNEILLDATDPFAVPNILPQRTINWVGRKIAKDGRSEMIGLTPRTKASETTMVNATLSDTGELEGSCSTRYSGHYAMIGRKQYMSGTEESYLEKLESRRGEIEIDDFEISKLKELGQPLGQKYSFYQENALETISGKKYLNPLLFLRTTENPFKSEKREYAIELGYPRQDRYMVNIDLPEGYVVESLPAPIRVALPEGGGSFTYNVTQMGNKVQLQCNMNLDQPVYAPAYYPILKEFFNQMILKNQEKIVLVKA